MSSEYRRTPICREVPVLGEVSVYRKFSCPGRHLDAGTGADNAYLILGAEGLIHGQYLEVFYIIFLAFNHNVY